MRDHDIKAPDGYLLGGLRRVRKDGTILFQRGYWQAPLEWAGCYVWVHQWHSVSDFACSHGKLEAWPPGVPIWQHGAETKILDRTQKPDAKPGYRRAEHKAWHNRSAA